MALWQVALQRRPPTTVANPPIVHQQSRSGSFSITSSNPTHYKDVRRLRRGRASRAYNERRKQTRCVAPWFIVRWKNAKMTSSYEFFIVESKKWVCWVQELWMKYHLQTQSQQFCIYNQIPTVKHARVKFIHTHLYTYLTLLSTRFVQ